MKQLLLDMKNLKLLFKSPQAPLSGFKAQACFQAGVPHVEQLRPPLGLDLLTGLAAAASSRSGDLSLPWSTPLGWSTPMLLRWSTPVLLISCSPAPHVYPCLLVTCPWDVPAACPGCDWAAAAPALGWLPAPGWLAAGACVGSCKRALPTAPLIARSICSLNCKDLALRL